MRRKPGLRRIAAACLLALAPHDGRFDDSDPLDQLDVLQVDRRVLAVNGRTGSVIEEKLELSEQVLHAESRGLVGVVVTSARLLGATSRSASFEELRYRIREREEPPTRVEVGERVVLASLATRLAGLGSRSSGWVELPIGPNETLERLQADANVGLAVSQRRAIAFPAEGQSFAEIGIGPGEAIEDVSLAPNSITLTTSRRVLVFQAGSLRWLERFRSDRP